MRTRTSALLAIVVAGSLGWAAAPASAQPVPPPAQGGPGSPPRPPAPPSAGRDDAAGPGTMAAIGPRLLAGAAQALDAMDTNHDGQISQQEFEAGWQSVFQRLDQNGDGVLDQTDGTQLRRRLQAGGQDGNAGPHPQDMPRDGASRGPGAGGLNDLQRHGFYAFRAPAFGGTPHFRMFVVPGGPGFPGGPMFSMPRVPFGGADRGGPGFGMPGFAWGWGWQAPQSGNHDGRSDGNNGNARHSEPRAGGDGPSQPDARDRPSPTQPSPRDAAPAPSHNDAPADAPPAVEMIR